MPRFSNEDVVSAVNKWQETSDETLRCSNDNCWDFLEPIIVGDKVILKCMNCKALYENMLEGVLENIMSKFKNKS